MLISSSLVLDRSDQVPVVVDLWAPWCGPCRTLGPILEDVIEATGGAVELAKVNVDENPRISAAFQVQSIPAVMAIKDRKVVDSFIGAVGRPEVEKFVASLAPAPSEADLLAAAGDEALAQKGCSSSSPTIPLRSQVSPGSSSRRVNPPRP